MKGSAIIKFNFKIKDDGTPKKEPEIIIGKPRARRGGMVVWSLQNSTERSLTISLLNFRPPGYLKFVTDPSVVVPPTNKYAIVAKVVKAKKKEETPIGYDTFVDGVHVDPELIIEGDNPIRPKRKKKKKKGGTGKGGKKPAKKR
jgi:hypothetical protein